MGRYLNSAMARMACSCTSVCSWSLGSSCSRSCRAEAGWDLAAASPQCHQTLALPKTLFSQGAQGAIAGQTCPLPQSCQVSPHLDILYQLVAVAEDIQSL